MGVCGTRVGTGLCAGILVAAAAAGNAEAQVDGLVWSYPSDGSWMAQAVSLGDSGSQVFVEYGIYLNSRVLLSGSDASPPQAVWEDGQVTENFNPVVDSASQGSVHVSMHQELAGVGSLRRAVLRKFSSDSSTPDWSYTFDPLISNHDYSEVRVSASGEIIVGAVYDSSQNATDLWVFNPSSPVPVQTYSAQTHSGALGLSVSGDGRVAVLRSSTHMVALDLETGETLLSELLLSTSFYGGIGLSGDGQFLAVSADNTVRVMKRGASGSFEAYRVFDLPGNGWCKSLAVSFDGSTLAFATNYFTPVSAVAINVVDIVSETILVDYSAVGSGDFLNMAGEVATSATGSRVAVGLWGDEAETIPELMVFDAGNNTPSWSYDLPGSVTNIDFSPDGTMLAAAMKGTHATQMGGGGAFHLFETRPHDFKLQGTPSVGDTVTFAQQHDPNAFGVVISAPTLGAEPRFFPGIGNLLLDENNLSFLPHIAACDTDGMAYTPYQIQNDAALIGTTVYFQGLGLRPRKLSEDMVRMTILP